MWLEQAGEREPGHGGDDGAAGQRSPPPSTAATPPASTLTRAVTPVTTLPPRLSTYSRAGSAYIMCSGLVGSAIAAARGSDPNISASTRANGGAAAASAG